MCRRLVRHPRTDHVGWRLKNVSYCSSSARPPPPCAGLLRRTGRVFERPPHNPARPSVFSRTHPATRSRASPAWLSRLLVRGSPLGLSLRLDAPPPRTRSLAVRRILVSSDDGRALRVLPPCPDRPRPPSRRLGELPCWRTALACFLRSPRRMRSPPRPRGSVRGRVCPGRGRRFPMRLSVCQSCLPVAFFPRWPRFKAFPLDFKCSEHTCLLSL